MLCCGQEEGPLYVFQTLGPEQERQLRAEGPAVMRGDRLRQATKLGQFQFCAHPFPPAAPCLLVTKTGTVG